MKSALKMNRRDCPLHPGLFWLLVCALCCASRPLIAQESVLTPSVEQPSVGPNQALIEEIGALRQRLGGGLEEQLKGIISDVDLKTQLRNDFDQALIQQLNQKNAPSHGPNLVRSLGTESPSERRAPIDSVTSSLPKQTIALRAAARKMEIIAAELEGKGLFQEADSLRDRARVFWLKSRRLPKSEATGNR